MHPLAAGFEEHLPGPLAPDSGQKAHEKLVARERAVGHLVERGWCWAACQGL